MFDFAWTQIGLIGVVALVLIGPKDLPIAIRTVAGLVKKARRMAGEFQGHVDEMVKDTDLADIRNQISEIRNFDIRREVERAVDTDGSLKAAFQQDPFGAMKPPATAPSLVAGGTEADAGHVSMAPSHGVPTYSAPGNDAAPAFVPPQFVPAIPSGPPAFVPPAFVPQAAAAPAAVVPPAIVPSPIVPEAASAAAHDASDSRPAA